MENYSFWPKLWHFRPKGDLKPCIMMYLGNKHNMSLVAVTFGNIFFRMKAWCSYKDAVKKLYFNDKKRMLRSMRDQLYNI